MEAEFFRVVGGVAGLAGLAVGMILLLYREILTKNVFPTLSKRDAYRLLQNIAVLAWSVAMCGIVGWVWSTALLHRKHDPAASAAEDSTAPLVVAGTVVDQLTDLGIGNATIRIDGENAQYSSEDNGNFRIALRNRSGDRIHLSVNRTGYLETNQSVMPPTHDLILQMRPR
jgi:hypothetical protein